MSTDHTECPLCHKPCPLVHLVEVDIGVGVIEGEHEWECPDHGRWTVVGERIDQLNVPIYLFPDLGKGFNWSKDGVFESAVITEKYFGARYWYCPKCGKLVKVEPGYDEVLAKSGVVCLCGGKIESRKLTTEQFGKLKIKHDRIMQGKLNETKSELDEFVASLGSSRCPECRGEYRRNGGFGRTCLTCGGSGKVSH